MTVRNAVLCEPQQSWESAAPAFCRLRAPRAKLAGVGVDLASTQRDCALRRPSDGTARLSKTLNLLRFEDATGPARVIDPCRRRTSHGLFVEIAED